MTNEEELEYVERMGPEAWVRLSPRRPTEPNPLHDTRGDPGIHPEDLGVDCYTPWVPKHDLEEDEIRDV